MDNLGFVFINGQKIPAILNYNPGESEEKNIVILTSVRVDGFKNYHYLDGHFANQGYVRLFNLESTNYHNLYSSLEKFKFDFLVITGKESLENKKIFSVVYQTSVFRRNIALNGKNIFEFPRSVYKLVENVKYDLKLIEVVRGEHSKDKGKFISTYFIDHQFKINTAKLKFSYNDAIEFKRRIKSLLFLLGFKDEEIEEKFFLIYGENESTIGKIEGDQFQIEKKINPFLQAWSHDEFIAKIPCAFQQLISDKKTAFDLSNFIDLFLYPNTLLEKHFLSLITIIESLCHEENSRQNYINLDECLRKYNSYFDYFSDNSSKIISDIKNTRNGLTHSNMGKISLSGLEFIKVVYLLELIIIYDLLRKLKVHDEAINPKFVSSVEKLKGMSKSDFVFANSNFSFFR